MIMVGDGLAPRRAAVRTVAGRWRANGRFCGTRAPTVRPNGPRAADRRPGAPSPTPGTVSSRAWNGADGDTGALGGASVSGWDCCDDWGVLASGRPPGPLGPPGLSSGPSGPSSGPSGW